MRPRSPAAAGEEAEAVDAGLRVPRLARHHQCRDQPAADRRGEVEVVEHVARQLDGRPATGVVPARDGIELGDTEPERPEPGGEDVGGAACTRGRPGPDVAGPQRHQLVPGGGRHLEVGLEGDAVHGACRQHRHHLGRRQNGTGGRGLDPVTAAR